MKKVALFFANGTEEVEALTPVDLLRRAGAEVTVFGVGSKTPVGSHQIMVVADKPLSELKDGEEYDMVILPGGLPGTTHLGAEEKIAALLSGTFERGGFVCAICAAPSVLGEQGLLKGKKATCYPGFEEKLTGAKVVHKRVVRDKNVITAAGAGAALEFALALVEALFGKEKAESLRASVIAK